jgi:hypothetical protein
MQGNTYADRTKYNMTALINRDFSSSPSYYEVTINNSDITVGVHITDNSKIDSVHSIVMQPWVDLSVGDVIQWRSSDWLCTSAEKFSDIYYRGEIQRCYFTLNFYDKNGVLYTIPYVQSVNSNLGVADNKYLTQPITKITIQIPKNDTTLQIKRGDIFKLADLDNYKVIDYMRVQDGLITLDMEYCGEEQPEPTPLSSIIGDSEIKINTFKTYTATGGTQFTFSVIGNIDSYILTALNDYQCSIKALKYPYYITLQAVNKETGEISNKEITLKSSI